MKGTFFVVVVVMFSVLAIPLTTLDINKNPTIPTINTQSNIVYDKNDSVEKIKVLKDGEILEYSVKDYIFGVVAAEMPALYEKEALKAQAVAAYTFACYKRQNSKNQEYDITSNPETAQCFITRDEAMTRWGEKGQEYAQKIDDCIEDVSGEILTYNNQPIFAAYHAISSGVTNNCQDVWGNNLPYLKSVDSEGDCMAKDYLTSIVFTQDEITEKLSSITSPSGEAQNYFTDIKVTDNGYVKEIKYCKKTVTGSQIRELLGLRSANFTIDFKDDVFTFSVKGYGHGVGMSQTGADYMAKQGKNYEEILLHYYNGAKLEKN